MRVSRTAGTIDGDSTKEPPMPGEVPFSVILDLLESQGLLLTRIYRPYRIFTKPGHLPIWIPVHDRKVAAVYVKKTQRILESEDEDGQSSP